jgi:hypothetical protein
MVDSGSEQRQQLDYMPQETGLFGGLTPQQIIRPLWLIFVGGVMFSLSFGVTIGSHGPDGWSLHLTDQPIGAALLAIGVWRLSRIDLGRDYAWLMRFILAVAILQIAASIADVFPLPQDPVIDLARIFLAFTSIVASIGFCVCMRWFCQDTRLWRSAKGWLRAIIVFSCSSVPFALFNLLLLLVALQIVHVQRPASAGGSWSWWYLLLVPFIVGPPLALLLCILQMGREMGRRQAWDL